MSEYLPRQVESTLTRHLNTMPVVVVLGARQTGKSTLVQYSNTNERRYETFDDLAALELVRSDPDSLLSLDQPLTLDEVQKYPDVLSSIKQFVDRERVRAKFLLTGSANLLLMRNVSESLAGRASYLTLWPMSRREQLGQGTCGLWEALATSPDKSWLDLIQQSPQVGEADDQEVDWRRVAKQGGFPVPAIELRTEEERDIWFSGYVATYIERDLRDLTNITNLIDFRRLVIAACSRVGQIVNQTELARAIGLPQATVGRYLNVLETSYQLVRIPAFAINRTKRLIKSPKLYWADTGVALHLSGVEPSGAHFENLLLNDLLVWRDTNPRREGVFHWRTTTGSEVDFVIESAQGLIPIELKTTKRPRLRDTKNLRAFQEEYKDLSRAGIVIHAGSQLEWLTSGVIAVPWYRLI